MKIKRGRFQNSQKQQESQDKKKKKEDEVIKWNVFAEVFQQTGEKGEAKKNKREEGV